MNQGRAASFRGLDTEKASGNLGSVLKEHNVFLGGASVGKGLQRAARFHLDQQQQQHRNQLLAEEKAEEEKGHLALPGAVDLEDDCKDVIPYEEPFYVVDLGVVVSQVFQWRKYFPRVEPFYAIKCNPNPVIIKTLAILRCHFDCASRGEIRLVQELTKHMQRQPDIIYANPCKARAHLIEAVCKGVRKVTFDNVVEVQKIASISKKIQLIYTTLFSFYF